MLYNCVKPFLWSMDSEKAHRLVIQSLKIFNDLLSNQICYQPIKLMGLNFPNRVGLAAGFDKNGECFEPLFKCGFGFVEVGTLTPKPQQGNAKPRLFRLEKDKSIINRMGFNNCGTEAFIENQKKQRRLGILGVNIGKNKDTADAQSVDDYLAAFDKVYAYADYITINVSSPNTPNLRALETGEPLKILLRALLEAKKHQEDKHFKRVPLVVKISPDLSLDALKVTADILMEFHIDAVIATNTTLSRDGLKSIHKEQLGGMSGAALTEQSTQVIAQLHQRLQGTLPIIAAGGIMSLQDAKLKMEAGATLIQLYSGFIFYGPKLIQNIMAAGLSSRSY